MQDTASSGSRSHLIFQFACWLGLLVGLTDMAGRLRSAEYPGLKWISLGRRGSTVDLYKDLKLPWCIFLSQPSQETFSKGLIEASFSPIQLVGIGVGTWITSASRT